MSATSLTIYLQTRVVHIKHNAPINYSYTGRSGKQEVTLELCYILRKFMIALHVTLHRLPNGMGFVTQCSDGSAAHRMAEKLQRELQEKHWRGLWSRAVTEGQFTS
jgi:hypothetical protein